MDLKELAVLGDRAPQHWYYRSKAAAMRRYLGKETIRRVLDVGAGSGFFTKYLLQYTNICTGLCIDTGYSCDKDERHYGKPLQFRQTCGAVDTDLVLFMDVLEHVADDRGLIMEYAEKVPTGARFLITVPAFQQLWSDHDVFLEHHRRYNVNQLETVVRSAGLEVEKSSYYFALVLPIAGSLRLLRSLVKKTDRTPQSDLKPHAWPINELLSLVCMAELPVLAMNRLVGLSVFCMARKI